MAIVQRFESEGQGVHIIKVKDGFRWDIIYFPKNRAKVGKQLSSPTVFETAEQALKNAEERIKVQVEKGNWATPLKSLNELFGQHYEHKD